MTGENHWVDSHCHLFAAEGDPVDVLDRAAGAGVDWLMCPGIDLETSLKAQRLATAHPDRVIWAAGLHPHDATRWQDEESRLSTLISVADAVGECGLDYYRDLSPRDVQRSVFAAQLELAATLGKPVSVHCRDAFADVYAALEAAQLGERAILHSWTGGPKWTKRFAALGAVFSFAGMITYPTAATLRLAVAVAPPERTMIETDTPYLSPQQFRDRVNEPAHLPATGAALAAVWGISLSEVAASTTATAARVYGRVE